MLREFIDINRDEIIQRCRGRWLAGRFHRRPRRRSITGSGRSTSEARIEPA
jgi:hypothetical protein